MAEIKVTVSIHKQSEMRERKILLVEIQEQTPSHVLNTSREELSTTFLGYSLPEWYLQLEIRRMVRRVQRGWHRREVMYKQAQDQEKRESDRLKQLTESLSTTGGSFRAEGVED